MHCDTTDESSDCNIKNGYCSDTFGRDHIDDRVVDNESTETSLEDEDSNRLGHHIDHIFLKTELVLKHLTLSFLYILSNTRLIIFITTILVPVSIITITLIRSRILVVVDEWLHLLAIDYALDVVRLRIVLVSYLVEVVDIIWMHRRDEIKRVNVFCDLKLFADTDWTSACISLLC